MEEPETIVEQPESSVREAAASAPDEEERLDEERLARATEAMVFAADEPLAPDRVAEVFAEVTGQPAPASEAVTAAVERINDALAAEGRSFRIETWGGGFRMATCEEWAPFVKTLLAGPRQQSLSRSLSETLAVVAYRQPVTRPEVDFIRGVSADYALRKLMELDLVDVQGRSESLGRPLLYGTTDHFLEEFGLAGLEDLPTLREVEELLDDPHFNKERAKLLKLRREEEAGEEDSALQEEIPGLERVEGEPSDTKEPSPEP